MDGTDIFMICDRKKPASLRDNDSSDEQTLSLRYRLRAMIIYSMRSAPQKEPSSETKTAQCTSFYETY